MQAFGAQQEFLLANPISHLKTAMVVDPRLDYEDEPIKIIHIFPQNNLKM